MHGLGGSKRPQVRTPTHELVSSRKRVREWHAGNIIAERQAMYSRCRHAEFSIGKRLAHQAEIGHATTTLDRSTITGSTLRITLCRVLPSLFSRRLQGRPKNIPSVAPCTLPPLVFTRFEDGPTCHQLLPLFLALQLTGCLLELKKREVRVPVVLADVCQGGILITYKGTTHLGLERKPK